MIIPKRRLENLRDGFRIAGDGWAEGEGHCSLCVEGRGREGDGVCKWGGMGVLDLYRKRGKVSHRRGRFSALVACYSSLGARVSACLLTCLIGKGFEGSLIGHRIAMEGVVCLVSMYLSASLL